MCLNSKMAPSKNNKTNNDTNDNDERNIFLAINSATVHRLHSIISSLPDPNIRDQQLRTPLIASISIQKDDVRSHVVRLLLRRGCDVNAQDQKGQTALMLACMEKEKSDVVAILTKYRECEPNIQDLDGNTALHLAVERGNATAVKHLVETTSTKSKVRVNELNMSGICPLQLAVKLRHADCCRALMKYGGADTMRIKNREALLELINEDRAQTPFDLNMNRSPTPCVLDSPMTSARFMSSRTYSDLNRIGSRANSSTSLNRPISDLNSARESARESARQRHDSLSRRSENMIRLEVSDNNCRADAIINSSMMSPRDATNPFADILREKSDLYVNNSRTTFKKSIISSIKQPNKSKQSHADWLKQNLNIRRPLTPIASRTITEETHSVSPTHVPLPGRLPSIPSGKRLCLVSPCETPSELY